MRGVLSLEEAILQAEIVEAPAGAFFGRYPFFQCAEAMPIFAGADERLPVAEIGGNSVEGVRDFKFGEKRFLVPFADRHAEEDFVISDRCRTGRAFHFPWQEGPYASYVRRYPVFHRFFPWDCDRGFFENVVKVAVHLEDRRRNGLNGISYDQSGELIP